MFNGKVFRAPAHLAIAGLLALLHAAPAAAGPLTQVAYYPTPGTGAVGGMLIDWQSASRVRLINDRGAQPGTATRSDTQTVVTLDAPLTSLFGSAEPDRCGEFPLLRQDTRQVVVRDTEAGLLRGASQVVEIGTRTPIEGCDAGVSVPFGAVTDAGTDMKRVAMVARPLTLDLLPGVQLAGLSDQPWLPDADSTLAADVVSFYAGNQLRFSSNGRVVPAAFNADRWLVLDLGGTERAYTRLAVDLATSAEVWLRADRAGGEIQRVVADPVVKLVGPVGFGTEAQAARVWESALFVATRQPFFIQLYQGGTGERVTMDLDSGTQTRLPVQWRLAGVDIVQTRVLPGVGRRERIWVPLRNRGAGIRFVMESDVLRFDDGRPDQFVIMPRVNHYIDRGPAVPEADAATQGSLLTLQREQAPIQPGRGARASNMASP